MKKLNELLKNLPGSEHTGRFLVTTKTGRKFLVEPIGWSKTSFGDINPATKKVEGNYGDKYRGSIDAKDSVITTENGFKNIIMLGEGESPLGYIDMLEEEGIERIEKLDYID
jgi:hypothetical protein